MAIDAPTWTDLVVAVASAALGWFMRHFSNNQPPVK